jgi:hypothetical protein
MGVTPQERYNNELLNELRTMNKLLTELLGRNAQVPEKKVAKSVIKPAVKPRGRRKGVVV